MIWINKRNFEDRVKISSKNPISPAIPAINVKALSLKKNNPIITNASQIPMPPPGVGREWELRRGKYPSSLPFSDQ